MSRTHRPRGRWLECLELVVSVPTRHRGTLALPLPFSSSFRACRSSRGHLSVPDAGLQQPASSAWRSTLHRSQSQSDQLHGSRRVDSLVGVVGVLADLWLRHENATTHVHESSPGFRRPSLRGTRPRRQHMHRPSPVSGERRGTAARIVRPMVPLGRMERLFQTLQRRNTNTKENVRESFATKVCHSRVQRMRHADRGVQHSPMHRDEKIFRMDTVAGRQRQLSEFERGLRGETFSIQLPGANGRPVQREGSTGQRGGTLL